jgi:(2R)-ethylmalonyl-CoA mutase
LRDDARSTRNLMPASIECAKAGVTTGEWAGVLRETFGEYRASTGINGHAVAAGERSSEVRKELRQTELELGFRLRFLVGKPGLDGHSNGAEQIAVRARDVGFEVVYQGIRLTPAEIVAAAVEEDVSVVGLSILSGSHMTLVPQVLDGLRSAGVDGVPVVVGGIVPRSDAKALETLGVAAVFTPKDFSMDDIMARILDEIRKANGLEPLDR